MMTKPPEPTRCPNCGTVAAEWICHICKRIKRDPDEAVGIASCAVGIVFLGLIAGGLA